MKNKTHLICSFLICSFITTNAQYTELINSNRPGTSQGAFAVGNQVLQLETGASTGWEEHRLLKTETDAFTIDYSLRYGLLWEQLEISFMGSYLSENVTDFRNPNNIEEYKVSNFKSNTLGAKYLVYDPYKKRSLEKPNIYSWDANNKFRWRELIPAVSVYAGVNVDTKDNPFLPVNDPQISPKFLLSTQNNFQGGWVFVTNIIVDRITSDFPTYSYIITLTHAFNQNVSAFVETQGIKSDFYADQLFRFGGAYLFWEDFQVDALATINFKDTPSRFFVGAGISYRLDMHSKDEFIEDESDGKRDDEGKEDRQDDFIEDDGK
ncbi:MAG: transporter [Flavobacteriaceae bacterium]